MNTNQLHSHQLHSLADALERNHIKCCFVPASCTGELQPLDLTVNQVFKKELKACFTKWYADVVKGELEKRVELGLIKPDIRIHVAASWLMPCTQVVTCILCKLFAFFALSR